MRRAGQNIIGYAWNTCVVGASIAVVGCAVGPDFTRPAAPTVTAYTATAPPATLAPGLGEPE